MTAAWFVARATEATGLHAASTLRSVDDFGEIDHSSSGDDVFDLAVELFASDPGVRFDVSVRAFWVKEYSAPNAFFDPGTPPDLRRYSRVGKAAFDGTDGVFPGPGTPSNARTSYYADAIAILIHVGPPMPWRPKPGVYG